MRKLSIFISFIFTCSFVFSQVNTQKSFHDTQGSIDVNGSGQLQFSLPVALPPAVKSVAPQINLVYTSGSGNGIAGYGWNLSGITAISRVGKNLDKDGKIETIKLNENDYFSFNGQRLILKSGEYGKDGAEYTTEKFSNVKIKSVGSLEGKKWSGPAYWEVSFEDGSQAWYGADETSKTAVEYNITKWRDAQGNYISYQYTQQNNVAVISRIEWGGNEDLNKPHFNQIIFNYKTRDLKESSYLAGELFVQDKILTEIVVRSNGQQFKKYVIAYDNGANGTKYQFVKNITEYNSKNQPANPITFEYNESDRIGWKEAPFENIEGAYTIMGDFDGDGKLDLFQYYDENECNERRGNCPKNKPQGYRLYSGIFNSIPQKIEIKSDFDKIDFNNSKSIFFKNKTGNIINKQGIAFIKYIPQEDKKYYKAEIHFYLLENNELKYQYHKKLPVEDIIYRNYNYRKFTSNKDKILGEVYRDISHIEEGDFDGDGIPEIILNISEYRIVEKGVELQSKSTLIVNTSYDVEDTKSFFKVDSEPFIENVLGDFNGNGKLNFIKYENGKLSIIELKKNIITHKYKTEEIKFSNDNKIEGIIEKMIVGDFNGDSKSDIIIPKEEGGDIWNIYLSNGKEFINTGEYKLGLYKPFEQKVGNRIGDRLEGIVKRTFLLQDVNGDGKTDFISFVSKNSRNKEIMEAYFLINYYENKGEDIKGKFIFEDKKILNANTYLDIYISIKNAHIYDTMHNFIPFVNKVGIKGNKIVFSTLNIPSIAKDNEINQFNILQGKINDFNETILIQSKNKILKYQYYNILEYSRIRSITQGGLKTEIEYKELDPEKNPNFYAGIKSEKYPYMELDKVAQSYAVSQLRQEIAPNQVRKQDFRYRGFITHLQGKGMIGFRKTARSSWYGDGYENTKVWSGAEIDPLNEGLPIREWSIKTNNESEIFPNQLSFDNKKLLSLKETKYQIDELQEGKIKAIVPTEVKTKDFIKNITSIDKVEYDEYYLPVKTISNTQNGFAEKITELSYYPLQLTGEGKDYSVGRPRSKTELVRAYGDSKGAKEEYEYENNLLKTLKTYNRDNTGYIQETYAYDGFGNIIEKTISNSFDTQTQTSKSKYDAKGRFVIEKTDNLGLITKISYNNWGQVLNQTGQLGDTLHFTYDVWGKVLTQRTNLGGTTQFTYEKLDNGDAKITEYAPDGGETIAYTNKIGQNYKTTTKVFGAVSTPSIVQNPPKPSPSIPSDPISLDPVIGIPNPPRNCIPSRPKWDISIPSDCIDEMPIAIRSVSLSELSSTDKKKENRYVSKEVVYDVLGRKIKESEPYFEGERASQWNTIEYDEYSRPIKATAFTGKIVETEYTGNSVKTIETNANGRFKKQVFDPIGNITTTEDKGGTIEFRYNAVGENIEAKYETNIVTTKYDEWGRKIEFHDPSNGLYKYEYNNGFGLLTKEISPKGYKEYQYNNKGQLIKQIEKSNDGTSTDKEITFVYNRKGLLTEQKGFSKGKEFSTKITYDNYGRVKSTQEHSFGKIFEKKNVVFDNLGRVKSYEKSLTSSGKTTSVEIENIYDEATGILYQVKDKTRDKVLWELMEHNAKGQITKAQLGGSKITNSYDTNGFLSLINHEFKNNHNLTISYSFNAIKNELNSRITGGDFNIVENFIYDDNNRLVNWTNSKTGDLHHNKYDKQGRILENDQLGKIKFENSQKIYQPTSLELNKNGEENLKNNLIQSISYNENNDPIFISGVKGDVSFEYGLSAMRQKVSFGGKIEENAEGKYTRYYSADGSFEITRDNETGEEKHIIYVGGSPYESEIIFVKDYKEVEGSYKFLHKDYLGSILAISDEEGNKLEQRHYDAWGVMTHLQIGDGDVITDDEIIHQTSLIIDRGYTSHEHFFEVGIIHMNGRLYDPLLRRFLNADENIQDPHNTQNYNKYGYVYNNPLMYNDPSGEFAFVPFLIAVGKAALIGAAVGGGIYLAQAIITGNFSLKGFGKSILMGAITGAVSGGISHIFSVSSFWGTVGIGALTGGVNGGITAIITGQNFIKGVVKGAVIGGAIAGVSWGVSKLFRAKGTISHDMEYSESDIVSDSSLTGNEEGALNTSDMRKTLKDNWNEAYSKTEKWKKVYVESKGSTPKDYKLDAKTGLFIKEDGTYSIAYTNTTYDKVTGEIINHRVYLSNKAYISHAQLNYTLHHELSHAVLHNNYGNAVNALTKTFDKLMDTEAHLAIQASGRSFLNLNNWNVKSVIGAYDGLFTGFYAYDHRYFNKLKPLVIRIK